MRDLTDREKKKVAEQAERVAKADNRAATLRRAQEITWAELLAAGVPAARIGRASGVSDNAVRNRVNRGPVKVSRGAGAARAKG